MSQQSPPAAFGPEHAAAYDQRFAKLSPMRDALHLLTGAILADLSADARILCVGAGTGHELLYLAQKFPQWQFTAVEPSAPMLALCRQKAEARGVANRCVFHEGYLDTLPPSEPFHAATSLLVSQFILHPTHGPASSAPSTHVCYREVIWCKREIVLTHARRRFNPLCAGFNGRLNGF